MKNRINYTKINKALMSLPIFVSTKKAVFEAKIDAFYGYSNISVSGKQLNAGFDLRLFCNLLGRSQFESSNKISIPLYEVRDWGISTDSKGKKHIAQSLSKMTNFSITLTDFSKESVFSFKLLSSAEIASGYITVTIDPVFLKLFDSEKFIYNLRHSHLDELSSLSARSLFIHLQSNQGFPKFKQEHLAMRLGVFNQPVKNQNRAIETGLIELTEKGFVTEWSKEILGGKIRNYRIRQCRLSERICHNALKPASIKIRADYPGLNELLVKFDFSFDELEEPEQTAITKVIMIDEWVDQDTSHFF